MRTPTIATLIALVLLLTGCIPQQPPPEPTPTPVFASEEEALAAAEEAYAEYLAMSDLIASEGGADPERLAPYVTEDWLAHEVDTFDAMQQEGIRIAGSTSPGLLKFQDMESTRVVVVTCYDAEEHRVLDLQGQDVTPADRISRVNLQITFQMEAGVLLVSGSEPWQADPSC